jgi:hypothetical protein
LRCSQADIFFWIPRFSDGKTSETFEGEFSLAWFEATLVNKAGLSRLDRLQQLPEPYSVRSAHRHRHGNANRFRKGSAGIIQEGKTAERYFRQTTRLDTGRVEHRAADCGN